MTDTITIPLNRLVLWDGNVRKTGAADAIDELAASIGAHGLLQSLIVRKTSRSRYAVIAGRRRFLALSTLAEDGRIAAETPIACRVITRDANPVEVGLAENVVRVAMHPADQFEAFRALIDDGATPDQIAARFGVSEAIVLKRMKLGRVSPALLDIYRQGGMSLEQVQAFTISDDPEAQERIWSGLPAYDRSPRAIRAALTEGEIPATDKRVRFIGLEAYEQAGGFVRRDLFDDRGGGTLADAMLLDRLVREKLDAAAGPVRAEGWAWTETRGDFGYGDRQEFDQIEGTPVPLPEGEAAELEALTEEQEALHDRLNDEEQPDDPAAVGRRLTEIDARLAVLTDRLESWSEADKANAGAILYLRHDGSICVERGLVRPEDIDRSTETAADTITEGTVQPAAPSLPAKLIEDLTAQKTAALRAELTQRPDVALAGVVYSLALRVFPVHGVSCIDLRYQRRTLRDSIARTDDCPALASLETERERWGDRLPGTSDDLWIWCLQQPQAVLLDLLALCAAHAVDAVQEKGTSSCDPGLLHADKLAMALGIDMTAWFTPTAANLFSRITRDAIIEALQEAKGVPAAPAWFKLKKADLAALAEREIAGTGWLPQPLRNLQSPDSSEAGSDVTLDTAA